MHINFEALNFEIDENSSSEKRLPNISHDHLLKKRNMLKTEGKTFLLSPFLHLVFSIFTNPTIRKMTKKNQIKMKMMRFNIKTTFSMK
jgi:hypothetical protein